MVIGVLSDTHLGSLDEAFCRRVEELSGEVDHFFHMGDSVRHEVLDFLGAYPLTAVAGNMDPPEVRANWPTKAITELAGRRFGLIHGWGPSGGVAGLVKAEFDDVDCICFGHTHKPCNQRVDGVLLFNPGAAMAGRRSGGTWGRLVVSEETIRGEHLPF